MELSSGTIFRSITPDKNFSFLLNGVIDNTTGESTFGFSGQNHNIELFEFKSGYILDFNKKNVYSYNPKENFEISVNIGQNYINYFINNTPICLYTNFTSNYYKYVYFKTNKTNINFDFIIKSNKLPNYTISFPFPADLGSPITGFIKNLEPSNHSFQIFSGSFDNQNFYRLSGLNTNFISGNQSGQILLNYLPLGDPLAFFENENLLNNLKGTLNLNTSFGIISENIFLPINGPEIYLLDLVPTFSGKIGDNYIYNFELLIKSTQKNNNIRFRLIDFNHNNEEILLNNVLWTNSLENWVVKTGLRQQNQVLTNTTELLYNQNIQSFSGNAFVPKNLIFEPYSGFNIQINRNNLSNGLLTGYAQYIIEISKENSLDIITYSGILMG